MKIKGYAVMLPAPPGRNFRSEISNQSQVADTRRVLVVAHR